METIGVYVCERCKVLLMHVDFKYASYAPAEMDLNGEYIWIDGENESELDYALCPICSGNDTLEDKTMKIVEIPKEYLDQLHKIWEELRMVQPEVEKTIATEYGIPLSNPKLKELLLEYLV